MFKDPFGLAFAIDDVEDNRDEETPCWAENAEDSDQSSRIDAEKVCGNGTKLPHSKL